MLTGLGLDHDLAGNVTDDLDLLGGLQGVPGRSFIHSIHCVAQMETFVLTKIKERKCKGQKDMVNTDGKFKDEQVRVSSASSLFLILWPRVAILFESNLSPKVNLNLAILGLRLTAK